MLRFILAVVFFYGATIGAALSAANAGRLEFEVLRNGQPFGRHEFVVTRTGAEARLEERARFSAHIGPFTVFRYEHDCRATWNNEILATLGCSTLKDGRRTRFDGERQAEGFVVQGRGRVRTFAARTPPTIFLTPRFLADGAYIDTETGDMRDVRVTHIGTENIEVAGRQIRAQHYRVSSSLTMDLWYDSEGRWVKGSFRARGQEVEYRLASPISEAIRG